MREESHPRWRAGVRFLRLFWVKPVKLGTILPATSMQLLGVGRPASPPVAAWQHLVRQYCCLGGARGRLKSDRPLVFANRVAPTGNLLRCIAEMFDCYAKRFGDSTGPLHNI